MRQTERDYREALDNLRFSDEAKERLIKNLEEQKEEKPVKRMIRPLWMGLIAAATCAALLGTAGAANLIRRQASIRYLEKEEYQEAVREEVENGYSGSYTYSAAQPNGTDMRGTSAEENELWWNGPGGELLEDTAGTAEDSWTAKRVFQYRGGHVYNRVYDEKREYVETRYRAEGLSDFNDLWVGLDTGWLEEHYTADSNGQHFRTVVTEGELFTMGLVSYYGDGDTMFNLQYCWDSFETYKDEYRLASNYAFTEVYTTADGVEVAIEMNPTNTGKTMFWVTFYADHNYFGMVGVQMELDDLHTLLDSLSLSNLLEYNPAAQ